MSTIGPIAATARCYPLFLEGQVLTHNDLNLLRDYLYGRFAFHNSAMFGFGVACGLDAVTTSAELTIEPGFALAQSGRVLELTAEVKLAWGDIEPVSNPADFGIGFVTKGRGEARGGLTAVLVPDDVQQPVSEECDPATGCRAHTIQWCEGARVVFAEGELDADQFLGGPVFKLKPLEPGKKGEIEPSDFTALRDPLAEILSKEKVEKATIDLLRKIELKAPEPGLNLMKLGVVNEVLYTLWEYERCRAYDKGDCFVETGLPAVALGWLDPATKTWNRRLRHHFRLSTALFRAINGYRGEDLCRQYLDHIRVLLQNFEPPPMPPPGDKPPKNPPKPDKCKLSAYYRGHCHWSGKDFRRPGGKFVVVDPARKFPPKKKDPGDPVPFELPAGSQPWEVAGVFGTFDPTDAGMVHLTPFLGFEGEASQTAIQKEIPGQVHVVDADSFDTITNLEPALVAAGSDAIYLGVDSRGAVISTGVVATADTLQQVPTIGATAADAKTASTQALDLAGKATEAADTAAKTAQTAHDGVAEVQKTFGAYREEITGKVGDIRGEWTQLRKDLPGRDTLIAADRAIALANKLEEVTARIEGMSADVANHKQGLDKATNRIEDLAQGQNALGQTVAATQSAVESQKEAIAQTASRVSTLDDDQSKLGRDLEQAKGDLAKSIQAAQDDVAAQKEVLTRVEKTQASVADDLKTETRNVRDRLDRVVTPRAPLPGTTGPAIPNLVVGALEAMRGAVETAAPRSRAPRVQERLAEVDPHLEALRTEVQPAAVAHAIETLAEAVAAAGLDKRTSAYRNITKSVEELRKAFGVRAPRRRR